MCLTDDLCDLLSSLSPVTNLGILVVYAIDNFSSFSDVQKYKEKIDRVKENEPYAL